MARQLWLLADVGLLLVAAACVRPAVIKNYQPQTGTYEVKGRVWQRLELRDRHGARYQLKVIVLGPHSDEHRLYTFTDEQTFRQFFVDDCAVVVVRGAETTLRRCH